jgi:hypothetical protein
VAACLILVELEEHLKAGLALGFKEYLGVAVVGINGMEDVLELILVQFPVESVAKSKVSFVNLSRFSIL